MSLSLTNALSKAEETYNLLENVSNLAEVVAKDATGLENDY